ncbi:hypothetical protein GT045_05190 [Streptomyces sp. SID486]|uniref:hypothetical protein n=1 Tax=unclassified Streptomyces TaxID=2593676 RepID=UPI00136A3715|nr:MULTISPECIES: hypothetical protein [unclassified Streptomyces]MYW16890.1 hypothetical protein [Streptomyces sp. SID2955]MYW16904.1 hypothetical protein [Streptomyces sp. SID2955]MYW43078.1 hypothetical protein [Streptomyces sp. SID161]MYX94215.1 hypothetical protein [Streptomyces sp. SID486]
MRNLLTRGAELVRAVVSGRRRLAKYDHPEAHRRAHPHRDAGLAYHYVPSAQQIPVSGSGGM